MSNEYIYSAIRRNKDNEGMSGKEKVVRKLIKNIDTDIEILKKITESMGSGTWRIYRTVNKRDFIKAHKELIHYLIDNPDKTHIESIWKTILSQPRNKAEKLFLIDIDDGNNESWNSVKHELIARNVGIIDYNVTPNGFHFITHGFDVRGFIESFDFDVTIKKDALFFVESYIND
jgi:hypothetical protein